MTKPARTKTSKPPAPAKRKMASGRRLVEFPQVKDKKLEAVEFSTCAEDHSITLRFHDKTELRLEIEPGFHMLASYADWKTGNMRPIRRWPSVRSQSFRG